MTITYTGSDFSSNKYIFNVKIIDKFTYLYLPSSFHFCFWEKGRVKIYCDIFDNLMNVKIHYFKFNELNKANV